MLLPSLTIVTMMFALTAIALMSVILSPRQQVEEVQTSHETTGIDSCEYLAHLKNTYNKTPTETLRSKIVEVTSATAIWR